MVEFIDGVKGQNSLLIITLIISIFIVFAIALAFTVVAQYSRHIYTAIALWFLTLVLFLFFIGAVGKDMYDQSPTISLKGEKFKVTEDDYRVLKLMYENILKENNGNQEKAYSEFLKEFLK